MKLLFDHNLSPRLVPLLGDVFPGSMHVSFLQMERKSDAEVWEYAGDNGFIIATKDSDFSDIHMLRGSPPKLIWIRLGNCDTLDIASLLRSHYPEVSRLVAGEISVLVLS